MNSVSKANRFLASWIAIVTFFSYSAYFFPKAIKIFFIAPIGLFVISILFYVSLVFLRRPRIDSFAEVRYIILLLLVLSFGLLYTNAPNYGFEKILVLYTWIVLFFVYGNVIVNNFEQFVKVSVLFGIVFVLLLLSRFGDPISFFRSMQGETLRLGYEMDTGMNSGLNPIWAARYLGYIFLLLLIYVREKPRNLFLYGYMLALILYIVTAGSKGPVIALFGGCFVFFANEKLSVNLKTLFYIVLVLAVLILILNGIDFFSSQFFIDRFSGKSTSAEEREGLMEVAFHYFGAFSFLFGTGTGNFGYMIYHRDVREYPHNIVVELYIENGIFAIIILALIYISVLKYYRMIFKSTKLRMLFAMFIYFGLNSMFSGDLLGNEYFFIFFMLFHFERKMIQKTEQLELQLEQFNSGSTAYLNTQH